MTGKIIHRLYSLLPKLASLLILTCALVLFSPPKSASAAVANDTSTIHFQLPHHGVITTYFSWWHPGIDLAAPFGTPIHPIAPGVIIRAGWDTTGYGNMVEIDHGNGYKSLYAHMDKIMVKVGESVADSDVLGDIGLTGRTTGPHTHLEISKDGVKINPLTVLPPVTNFPSAITAQETGTGGPVVVASVPSSLGKLPSTGLPFAGLGLAGLVPLGKKLKRYGHQSLQSDGEGLETWKKRELQRIGLA